MTTTTKPRQLFVNIAVRDLERSKAFFAKLGFSFNPKFTDDKAACMIVGSDAFVMLLSEPFFKTFTKKTLADAADSTQALYAFSAESREEVDRLVKIAIESGGSQSMPPQDHGFMYGWSFCDPDGHQFEVIWMDPKAAE
ncbi:MAG: glyoxalase/bleomycin resistance/extradiol dioxygenase family protein [Polyangiaceae bacterium]|nr:glyoxalase/bleomycin resistance/extradiol dioxygenase family protein [Polyangiaceae bacterium]